MQNYFFSNIVKFLFILLVLIRIIPSQLKDIKFERLTGDDGLPSGLVYCVYKDTKGFIWFGTAAGLARFDGYDFKVYNTSADKPGSISLNEVRCIFEDREGYLWCGTGFGLNKLDRDKDSFIVFRNVQDDSTSISDNEIMFVIEDIEGTIWVGTRAGGLNKYNKNTGKFTVFKNIPGDTNSLSNNSTQTGYIDRTGNLWVGTFGRSLNRYNVKNNNFEHYSIPFPEFPAVGVVTSLFEDINNNIWVGTTEGLNKLIPLQDTGNINTGYRIKRYFYNPPRFINSTVEDEYNNIWVCCTDGLIILNPETEEFSIFKNVQSDSNNHNSSLFLSINKDRDGTIWLPSLNGISYYNKNKWKFIHSLNNVIFNITECDNNTLFLGTYQGLYSYNRLNNSAKKIFYYKKNPDSWQHNQIQTLSPVFNNYMYFNMGPFFYTCEINNGNTSNYKYIPNIWIPTFIFMDHEGLLWLSIWDNDIIIMKNDLSEVARIQNKDNDSISITRGFVTAIYEDKDNVIWVGTAMGLNKIVTERSKTGNSYSISFNIKHYEHKSDDMTSLSNNFISCINEDKKGNLWIGTNGGGLNKYDKTLDKFTNYTSDDGLPDNAIMGILHDNNNNLWISTFKGLSKFNPETEIFKNYNKMDGLPTDQFSFRSYCKTYDGKMYFGTWNGLVSFYPDSIKDNLKIPPVVLTSFKIFNKEAELEKSLQETDEIELSYRDNFFSFGFSALDYTNPMKNEYMYMLEGIDKDWVKTPASNREASYTDIDPGEYVFRVKGSNNDGVWNEEGASLKIIIPPPFWATWWAYGFYLTFIVSVLYGIRKYEMNRLKWKNQFNLDEVKLKEKEETDKIKSRFFANISHEFRTHLTLILGPVEELISKFHDKEIQKQTGLIRSNANRLLNLINQLLNLSRLEAGKLELKASEGNIVPLIKGITMSFESIADRKNILLTLKSEKDKIIVFFNREMIIKIMTNLLSNAFKFTGEGGQITVIILETHNNSVEIKVKDTGTGISVEELPKLFDRFYQVDSSQTREYQGSGLGLALTKELIELHRGIIQVNSIPGEGSEFTIELPLGRKHLTDKEIVEITEIEEMGIAEMEIDVEDYVSSAMEEADIKESFDKEKNVILIVEDNSDVRGFIRVSLGDDFEFKEASNGVEGLLMAGEFIPDLIISDIMMPKMDGNELTKKIKNDEKTSHIPVILLTAKSEHESRLEGLQTGADDYLVKPFDSKELGLRIKNLIDIRRKLQEKYSKGDFSWKQDTKKLSRLDEQYMSKVMEVIENHLAEEEFCIEIFDKEMGMGRVQNYRKLKALTGFSPSRYIRKVRLVKAREMIHEKKGNISEIAYSVGFSSPAYFTRCFKEEFGYSPSDLKS